MRGVIAVVTLLAASPVAAEPASNPAFLGVGMQDVGIQGPCQITQITKGSGAELAGLQPLDRFVSLDGVAVPTCDALVALIQAREPGDRIKLVVSRRLPHEHVRFVARGVPARTPTPADHAELPIEATLYSRADVLRQRYVGKTMRLSRLVRVEDASTSDPSFRGKTTIVGWFDPACSGCDAVFARVARWLHDQPTRSSQQTPVVAMATTSTGRPLTPDDLAVWKQTQRRFDVPLYLTDPETFATFAITEAKRMSLMVVDCRGVVQYAVPLMPGADDTGAVLDELFAATEQAARRK